MTLCQQFLAYLGYILGTMIIVGYVLYQHDIAKGRRKPTRWWEKDLF